MVRILVLFYSTYGHNFKMAAAAVEGAKQVAGAEVVLKRIAETLPIEVLTKMYAAEAAKQWEAIPVATVDELPSYDGIIISHPTRFGMVSTQVKTFLDATGGLWAAGKLVGKVASVMTSSGSQHGGQETTILSLHTLLLHHGMVIVGLPPTWGKHGDATEIHGCSYYGASTIAGIDGSRQPSALELDGARFQGKHVAEVAKKLAVATA